MNAIWSTVDTAVPVLPNEDYLAATLSYVVVSMYVALGGNAKEARDEA